MPEPSHQSENSENSVLLRVEAEPRTGSRNMATDEYLLEAALSDGLKAVRMYRWIEPTVSLGYFQDSSDEALQTTFQKLTTVRRLSGGGAILHHHELTYSFVLPPDNPLTKIPTELYGRVHSAIIKVLGDFGAECAMRGEDSAKSDEPFLCFVRGDRHDIHCTGHKVVGSAQRRRKGAVLQHGSIILKRSPHAPEISGLSDLSESFQQKTASAKDVDDLESAIGDAIAQSLGTAIAQSPGETRRVNSWPADSTARIAELEEARYSSVDRIRK